MFEGLLNSLFDHSVLKDADSVHERLSELFGYSQEKPEIKVAKIRKVIYHIIDPAKGIIYTLVAEIGGVFDRLKNRIYLNKDWIKDRCERISLLYHEMTHKFLERFNLPREVEEGYASWLTKKLTGYARDAYGKLRQRFGQVYQRLGDRIFDPKYSNKIVNEFYGNCYSHLSFNL